MLCRRFRDYEGATFRIVRHHVQRFLPHADMDFLDITDISNETARFQSRRHYGLRVVANRKLLRWVFMMPNGCPSPPNGASSKGSRLRSRRIHCGLRRSATDPSCTSRELRTNSALRLAFAYAQPFPLQIAHSRLIERDMSGDHDVDGFDDLLVRGFRAVRRRPHWLYAYRHVIDTACLLFPRRRCGNRLHKQARSDD